MLAIALVIGGMGVFAFQSAAKTEDALCALRGDLETRVATTEDFLHQHPKGIPGIPAEALRISLNGQQRTIEALDSLSC